MGRMYGEVALMRQGCGVVGAVVSLMPGVGLGSLRAKGGREGSGGTGRSLVIAVKG